MLLIAARGTFALLNQNPYLLSYLMVTRCTRPTVENSSWIDTYMHMHNNHLCTSIPARTVRSASDT